MTAATFQRRIAGLGNHIAWSSKDVARIAERMGLSAATADLAGMATERSVPSAPSLGVVSKSSGSSKEFLFTISTAAVDRMSDTIAVNGWRLDDYRKNPVVLWSHNAALFPVGKATQVWTQGGKLKASMRFGPGHEAAQVREQFEAGILRATSVGFRPLKWSFSDDARRQFGNRFPRTGAFGILAS